MRDFSPPLSVLDGFYCRQAVRIAAVDIQLDKPLQLHTNHRENKEEVKIHK